MKFEGFSVIDFPPAKGWFPGPSGGFVYVFCWVADGVENPFYVGQTQRFSGRMVDYRLANFKACTDFRVGEAVKYLKSTKGYRVIVRYRASAHSRKEEYVTIRKLLLKGAWLLNCFPSYNYRKADEPEERKTVQEFCDMLTGSLAKATCGN